MIKTRLDHLMVLFDKRIKEYSAITQLSLGNKEIEGLLINEGFSRDAVREYIQDVYLPRISEQERLKLEMELMQSRVYIPTSNRPSRRYWT